MGGATTLPRFESLLTFLETQFRILDCSIARTSQSNQLELHSEPKKVEKMNQNNNKSYQNASRTNNNTNADNSKKNSENCLLCSDSHWILYCQKFNDWTPIQRRYFAVEKKMCFVCLHIHEKDQCRSNYRCKKCKGAHSFKLHIDDETPSTSTIFAAMQNNSKIYATALVKVRDKIGVQHILRTFIDMGSGGALISERATQLLCLPRRHENMPLTGVDNVSLGKSTNSVQIQIESAVDESFKLALDAHVLRTIIPPRKFPDDLVKTWTHLNDITLADPHYMNPSHIDLLFGVDIYGLIIKKGIRKGLAHEPVAQNSHFGWLVFGISEHSSFNVQINAISLGENLRKFWENEEMLVKPIMTEEHANCVEHFQRTHERLPDGSFMVSLPFNMNQNDPHFLGESKKMALCQLFQIEKRFRRDSICKQRYFEEINGYLERNHMSLFKTNLNDGYFLPHHAVVRKSSTTTKQRTVYDASAKTTNGSSLNDRCLNGPTIQPELVDIFIRWRTYKIALIADIEKMYRMIKIRPKDRTFQKILWRFSENEPIKISELNTVTFGTKPAPYLAIATTFAIADAEKENYPEAAKRIKTDFYVFDCMSGSHSIESAIDLQKQLDNLCKSGHFLLRKWASNEPSVLQQIPQEHCAIKTSFELNMNESIKTFGLVWKPSNDELS